MRRTVAATAIVLSLLVPSLAHAAVPLDRNDPCAHAGRDTCGTTGVGFYRVYRYGIRWFGDYRRAVRGEQNAFCLDLRFWYASRGYRYRRASVTALRNRDGEPVSPASQRKLAYAIWAFGRSDGPIRQAAVALYVHSLMGDARPGEVDPAALGPDLASVYRRISRASSRYHGPYRIEARLPAKLTVGKAAAARIRVVSAAGYAVPHVALALSAAGAGGVPKTLRTGGAGLATFTLTPIAAAGLRLRVRASGLAAPRPHVFAASVAGARANAQRLAAPASRAVAATVLRTDVTASPQISTQVSTQTADVGASVTDTVTTTGLGGAAVPVQVELWGPFERSDRISCSGTPYWRGSFVAHGDGTTPTQPVRLDRPGYYAFRESIAAAPRIAGFTTPCGETAETTFAKARPQLTPVASHEVVRPGTPVSGRIRIQGLGATSTSVEVELYGPFGSRTAVDCRGSRLRWRGRIRANGNGEVGTPPVKLDRVGFYGYRARLAGSPLVAGTATACGSASSTALVVPQIVTGRGDLTAYVRAHSLAAGRPVRLRVDSVGIDTPVAPVAIDLKRGVLGIPGDIRRTGWWRDGAAPGAARGSILIAGHVDSATAGAGAFFRLGRVGNGDRVEVATAGGRRFVYRVVSVRSYAKPALPTSVFSRSGAARLVLVTCGGPFDETTGHYRDDVVVTATPVR